MSIYQKSQYSNLAKPYRASYPYYIPHLNGGNPQTMYPYDAVYDQKYQGQNMDPRFQYYGNMEYPQSVQRHRMPYVYYNPKPKLYVDTTNPGAAHYYDIPPYPPYVYWYPNPMKCRDICGNKICDAYFRQINNYRNCTRCQRKQTPQCWSPEAQECVQCAPEEALASCASLDRYGSPNPNGQMHANVPPQNPLYTGCKLSRFK